MDSGLAAVDPRDAISHPPPSPRAGKAAREGLAGAPAGSGGLARSQSESRRWREHGQSDSTDSLRDPPDGHRRLSAALLDRTPAPVSDLRLGARRRAGARAGARG